MFDSTEKIGESLIQYGKQNDRIYLIKLSENDYPEIIDKIENLAKENKFSKIFAKIPASKLAAFQKYDYLKEAFIPGFYNGKTDAVFLAKFLTKKRKSVTDEIKEQIAKNIEIAESKKRKPIIVKHNKDFEYRPLTKKDVSQLTDLYKKVFDSYPFPIFKDKYIEKTMDENIIYFGIFLKGKLIAASSAETDIKSKNVEMTDFATLPEFRGNSLALILLKEMEAEMTKQKFKTAYTIARSISKGMNITFSKSGYNFTGTLINNTNISGNIECMNIWYKPL